ncbi:unnamed protein product [Strongylus vulgaris]|uniref:Uncharacterized protein n=1 Tax=Strongylus vulgaris TaxID=40348 RepID=A0A3P7JBR1_STRVU|nr:unnamed protein product [Strongylus vulgaris]
MVTRDTIYTAKGLLTYAEVEQYVFRPNNYKIVKPTFPIPELDFITKPTCEQVIMHRCGKNFVNIKFKGV